MISLTDEALEDLKKGLADMYDLIESTVHVEFDAEGVMHVTARKNGVVRLVQIRGEIVK
jgi:hypothetical protein